MSEKKFDVYLEFNYLNLNLAVFNKANNKLEYYICTINGKDYSVPLDSGNRHYAEIKRQVDAGELTIEDAD